MPTEKIRLDYAVLGLVLGFFAIVNMFGTMTPIAASNEYIYRTLDKAVSLPANERLTVLSTLLKLQEKALTRRPSEPSAWSRLSYLRLSTEGNQHEAFEALRMSDLVSPYEAPQLPERAVMWRIFSSVETPEQQAYADTLWQKAYSLVPGT